MSLKATAVRLFTLLFLICQVAPSTLHAQTYLNAQMPWHPVVLDTQGKVLAWYQPEKHLGYDQFMRLDFGFLEHKVPIDTVTNVKVYLTAPIYDEHTLQGISWQVNPPSTYAHLMDALVGWYAYSADEEAVGVLREMLDYQLAHGTTPKDWNWAEVPFATGCLHDKEYGRCLQDMPQSFYGGIESDKIGEMGLGYVYFYEMTGDRKYLEAGIKCADALVKHIRPGDATHTPWAFRIDAKTGTTIAGEEFGGMVVASVRLFDELQKINTGDVARYKTAREVAWTWLLKGPLAPDAEAYDKWTGYYEDVPKDTVNENDMNSMMTAYYILSQDDPATVDPNWGEHVGHLLDRSRAYLGVGPFYGAWAIDEQHRPDGAVTGPISPEALYPPSGGQIAHTSGRGCCSRAGLVCRTSQWGAINAMYFHKTHDGQAREDAFRSLNYATYFSDSEGKISCCGKGGLAMPYWFEDGYSDAGRSFMWAMGAVPDFAPIGQDHILQSTTVVQKVTYGPKNVSYRTFSPNGSEVLRLSFKPARVAEGSVNLAMTQDAVTEGYTVTALDQGDYEVHLHHLQSNNISISGN
jgi:hypothetical protein